jgi:hypothetical protein
MFFEDLVVVAAEPLAVDGARVVAFACLAAHGAGSFSACSRVVLSISPSARFAFMSLFIASAVCRELVEKLVTFPVLILYQNVAGICKISLMAS